MTTGIDTGYLNRTDTQVRDFLHVLAWYVGTARKVEQDCLTAVPNEKEGTLTVYWIKGNALGSLTVYKSDALSSAAPQITGRFRSLSMLRELELQADIRHDGAPPRTEVWPRVTVHWRDGTEPHDISTIGLTAQSAYKRATGFIARIQEVIAQGIDGK